MKRVTAAPPPPPPSIKQGGKSIFTTCIMMWKIWSFIYKTSGQTCIMSPFHRTETNVMLKQSKGLHLNIAGKMWINLILLPVWVTLAYRRTSITGHKNYRSFGRGVRRKENTLRHRIRNIGETEELDNCRWKNIALILKFPPVHGAFICRYKPDIYILILVMEPLRFCRLFLMAWAQLNVVLWYLVPL